MIGKFVSIHNVGKFRKFDASGDISLNKISVIFSDNGRGKTTLASILRSLNRADPRYILERKTLGTTEEPLVEIRLDSVLARFASQDWNVAHQNILIFDSLFIDENVYSGLTVYHGHKRNLYEFIIGEQGVELAKTIAGIDAKTREISKQISEKERQIGENLPQGVSVQEFLNLEEDPDIDKKIAFKEKEVAELENIEIIQKTAKLNKLTVPAFDLEDVTLMLSKTLPEVSEEALIKTREHIASHLGNGGEVWLRTGLDYVKDDTCPFCGQSIIGLELINTYRSFFSESYKQLKNEISTTIEMIHKLLSQEYIMSLQRLLLTNQRLTDFWEKHITFVLPDPDLDDLSTKTDILREATLSVLRKKEASPLDDVVVTDELKSGVVDYKKCSEVVDEYNEQIDQVNTLIQNKKDKTKVGDLNRSRSDLNILKLVEIRQKDNIKTLCKSYGNLVDKKRGFEALKEIYKLDLDELTKQILKEYQDIINKYLQKFGADFRIEETNRRYAGGKPSASYLLSINDQCFELGDDSTPEGIPCFKNTLSDGDRRTLAFAFFLTKLEQEPNLADKIIVFDDPVASFDRHRKTHAAHEIMNFFKRARQVLILSHDPHFCFGIWKDADKSERCALKIVREGPDNSLILEWNPELDTRSEYFKDYFKLKEYLEHGTSDDPSSIARRIRPLLEGNLRMRFPDKFPAAKWLGDFIMIIRDVDPQDLLAKLKPQLNNLEEVNDFAKKFHHDTNPLTYQSERTTDSELVSYVTRTLDFIVGV